MLDWYFIGLVVLFVSAIVGLVVLICFKESSLYLYVRKCIPWIMLLAIIANGYVSLLELWGYISRPNSSWEYVFKHPDTYTAIATFVTLLGFYQILVDRVEKYQEVEKLKKEESLVPLSKLKVITYAEHLRLVKEAEKKLRKKLKKEV